MSQIAYEDTAEEKSTELEGMFEKLTSALCFTQKMV